MRQTATEQWPLALLIYFPFLVVTLAGSVLIPHWLEYSREAVAFFLLSSLVYGLVLILPTAARKGLLPFIMALLGSSAFIKISFYFLYQARFSSSALFVIFETNSEEAADFLTAYWTWQLFLLVLVLYLPFVISLYIALSKKGFNRVRSALGKSLPVLHRGLILVLMVLSVWVIKKRYQNENVLITSISAYKDFKEVRENLSNLLAKTHSNAFVQVVSDPSPRTLVVVLGESSSSWHMQLYGYPRQTNPLLSQKKDLMVFNDVITPHVHTLLALEKILTISNNDNEQPELNGSVVQLANAAGYKTFWISNQQPVGMHESISTIIANAADEKHFESTNGYQYTVYDQALIDPIESALSDEAHKKIIFVHLIGTHARYYKRYPKSFEIFNGKDFPGPFKSKEAIDEINQYDNAMRYNDYVLDQIINLLSATIGPKSFLYLSDHGDEVYDTMEMAGHSEYWATSPMYEVPFLLWSPETQMELSWQQRPYLLDDFIHSYADLAKIQFKGWDASKSIFGPSFQPKKRLIKDQEDYDLRPPKKY